MQAKVMTIRVLLFALIAVHFLTSCTVERAEPELPREEEELPLEKRDYKLAVGDLQLSFSVPASGKAYETIQIPYALTGPRAEKVAISANSFEHNTSGIYYDSFIPGRLRLSFEYLGYAPMPRTGHDVEGEQVRSNLLPVNKAIRHHFRLVNNGDTIIKALGAGAVNLRLLVRTGGGQMVQNSIETAQMLGADFYPGESREFTVVMDPVQPGKYQVQFVVAWQNDNTFFASTLGEDILTMTAFFTADEAAAEKEAKDPPRISISSNQLRRFPEVASDFQEFMYSATVISGQNSEAPNEGVLELQIPPWDHEVVIKLITGSSINSIRIPLQVRTDHLAIDRSKLNADWIVQGSSGEEHVISTWYYPYRAVRFSSEQMNVVIKQDLLEMKESGINLIWLQLFPQFFYIPEPSVVLALENARELGIKVVPSIYFHNQSIILESMYGVPLERAGTAFSDPLDWNLGTVITRWFGELYEEWGDVFYRTKDGMMPVTIAEEYGLGYPHHRIAGFSEQNKVAFREWLRAEYADVAGVNEAWSTSYRTMEEINPQLSNVMITDYPAEWREGTKALDDLDRFRSQMLANQLEDTSRKMKARFPDIITGIHYFSEYGFEGLEGNHMYNFSTYNDFAARTAAMAEYVFDRERTGIDYVAYLSDPGEVDWSIPAQYALDHGYTPLSYPRFNAMQVVQGKGMHYGWKPFGGWQAYQGVEARDINALYPVLIPMLQTVNTGGIAGFYGWNDHPLLAVATAVQKREVRLMAELLNGR